MTAVRKSARLVQLAKLDAEKKAPLVHVLYYFCHVDCYKRADSKVEIISVSSSLRPILTKCILHNIDAYMERRNSDDGESKFEIEGIEVDVEMTDADISRRLDACSDDQLANIHEFIVDASMERRGEFTMMASHYLYLYESKRVE